MRIGIVCIVMSLLLTGCLTPEQMAAYRAQEEAAKQQQCADMGAPLGSPDYYDCRKTLQEQAFREAQEEEKHRRCLSFPDTCENKIVVEQK